MESPLTVLILLLVAAGILWVLIDFCSVGHGLTSGLIRWICTKRTGVKEIDIPAALSVAVANGLIRAGAELVTGYENEWDGETLMRIAIPPEIVNEELGTRLIVISVGSKRMKLARIF